VIVLAKEVAMEVVGHLPVEELKRLERAEKDAGRSRRLRIVILGLEGWTAPAVAKAVGLTRRICQRWVARYNAEGLAGLEDRRGQEPGPKLSPEQADGVRLRVESGPTQADGVCSLRGKDFQRILAAEFGLLRSLSGVYYLLHQLGYSCLRPRPRHRKADPEAVEAFKASWPERVKQIAVQHPDKRLRVYFQDESRFGQQGTNTSVWAKKGSRPTAVRQTEYEYLWVLGAVCPPTGHAEGLLSPQLNTKVVNSFLELFSKALPEGEHAVMVWDGAGFHRAKALEVPANVTLVELPPYSPELNPVENLWHYLKSHYWSNRSYADYEALEQAALDAWHAAVLDQELVKSVCAAPYLQRATSDWNPYHHRLRTKHLRVMPHEEVRSPDPKLGRAQAPRPRPSWAKVSPGPGRRRAPHGVLNLRTSPGVPRRP
jgi:transposase